MTTKQWWRSAVIYQIYPRSFADANADGIGDLPGITARLNSLAQLGVDAIWLSPFMTSPQKDAGYDVANYCDVDPLFGSLSDFDLLLARSHELGLKVIVDLVPNHCSVEHPWFVEALASAEESIERKRFIFRPGKGANGEIPPNNWESVFGGPAWTRVTNADGTKGHWYLHLFDSSQPDFDWTNQWVKERFIEILKFWLDRGVDGFRVDVAHGLSKAPGLPDFIRDDAYWALPAIDRPSNPYFGHSGVHEIFKDWRKVLGEYPGERILCAEAFVEPLTEMAKWVRPDEMHQAFNFPFLVTRWNGEQMRKVISDSLSAFNEVGAPSTWVLSNHDQIRHATRLAMDPSASTADRITGIGPLTEPKPDPELGITRARAATLMMLALPGVAYLYQGEELGLPEATEIPDNKRQDPTFFRTNGQAYGRDGCRVPIPWESDKPNLGFGESAETWLPQPLAYRMLARDIQEKIPQSTLNLYKQALQIRKSLDLGNGEFSWISNLPENLIGFTNNELSIFINYSQSNFQLPLGEIILSSEEVSGGILIPATCVWLKSN